MQNNLKNRIYTSFGLIFLLILMFLNTYVLGYFLMIIGIFSVIEFSNIILRLKKNNIFQSLFFNLLFLIYIFSIFSTFLVLSFFSHLKILLFIILITCVSSDIGGYIFGKVFKGPKLTRISPKKTISGSLGSMIFSMIFFIFVNILFHKKF